MGFDVKDIGGSLQEAVGKRLSDLGGAIAGAGHGGSGGAADGPAEPAENSYCTKCGAKLMPGAVFCARCGAKVGERASDSAASGSAPVAVRAVQPADGSKRQVRFAGRVLKCPGCGATIKATEAVCPECGLQLLGRAAAGSVAEFANKLLEIEQSRKRAGLLDGIFGGKVDTTDEQKKILINTFPIPNTVEELTEFMYLAVSNIDDDLSYHSFWDAFNDSTNPAKEISDAWVAKMQQAYLKAERSFPDDPAFEQVRDIYEKKMHDLNIKIK